MFVLATEESTDEISVNCCVHSTFVYGSLGKQPNVSIGERVNIDELVGRTLQHKFLL